MLVVWVWTPWLGLSLAATGYAQTNSSEQAVEAGRKALASRGNYPWYDPVQDTVRRIDVQTPQESATHRNSTWEPAPPPAQIGSMDWSWLRGLAWTAMLVLLLVVLVLLVRAFLNHEAGQEERPDLASAAETQSDADWLESLSFPVPHGRSDLLAEAEHLHQAGRYSEAVIYLFSYQLVQLDKHQFLRLARGKTNRQYLREIGPRSDLRDILSRTVVAFEDVFFGQHDLNRERFEACWSRLDEVHHRLEEAPSA